MIKASLSRMYAKGRFLGGWLHIVTDPYLILVLIIFD
jgi:hypothetical protein